MNDSQLPVIAAIPAHNAAKTLPELIDELIAQKYDDIYILDDASTDSTVKIVKAYGGRVKLIKNNQNVGSGANRNRIIGKTPVALIHFIDADMRLLSKNTPNKIRGLEWPNGVAYVGGMVRNPDGSQNPFNYGPRPHILTGLLKGGLQFIIWILGRINKITARTLRSIFSPLLRGLPNIYKPQHPRHVYWVAESNMIVRSDFFAKHGGFDPNFRYSEIADLALRMHREGWHGYFYPGIDALHLSWDNVLKSRHKRYIAHKQFLKKHGRLAYYFPPLSDYLFKRKNKKL